MTIMTDSNTRRRVKLYMLNESRVWDDQGTGHVTPIPSDKVVKGLSLVVKSEVDGKVLLDSKIQINTAYQKQQETLIVWSEVDNCDYALSFQDKAGCDEIWEKICEVQGKDPSVEITQDVVADDSEDMDDDRFDDVPDVAGSTGAAQSVELPPCELGRLEEIGELFSASLLTPVKREKLALAIEGEGYVRRLVDLYRVCEDLENVDGLRRLYSIFKAMFLLNKTALFEMLFADELIMDVIGVLENDPALAQPARHREYIRSQAKLKEVIPLSNAELVRKIHQTYRVQYIQDIILPLPSMFEENLLSTLNSFVYFNKMEIVTMIQEDEKFLQSLFAQLTDDELDDSARRDLVLFLKEFCTFSQTLAQQNREGFFKVLTNLGVLNTIESLLGLDDASIRSLAVDVFSFIVEFNPSIVRDFVLLEAQSQDDEDLIINLIIEQLTADSDPELGGAMQLLGTVRLLIDPENMVSTMQKTEKSEFLQFFYRHCMHVLTAPLFANTAEDMPAKDDYQTAQLLSLILELLTFCVEHHTYHVKTYVMSKNLLRRVLVLLKSHHSFLCLAALRLLRRMVGLKDEFYNRYIVKNDLLRPVVDAFVANGTRYNLLNSAVIELFEFIRTEDIKSLVSYVVERHYAAFEGVTYVQTFKVLKQRHDQALDRLHNKSDQPLEGLTPLTRQVIGGGRFQGRGGVDEEEELWFEQDDDDDGERGRGQEEGDLVMPALSALKGRLELDYKPAGRPLSGGKTAVQGSNVARKSSPIVFNKTLTISISLPSSPTLGGLPPAVPHPTPASSPNSSPDSSPAGTAHHVSPAPVSPASTITAADTPPASQEKPIDVSQKTSIATGGLVGLVDYPDEDSDEDESSDPDSDVTLPATKRPRLST